MSNSEEFQEVIENDKKLKEDSIITDFNSLLLQNEENCRNISSSNVDSIVNSIRDELKNENRINNNSTVDFILKSIDEKKSDDSSSSSSNNDFNKNENNINNENNSYIENNTINENNTNNKNNTTNESNNGNNENNNIERDNNSDNKNNNIERDNNRDNKNTHNASVDSIIQSIREELKNSRNIRSFSIDSDLNITNHHHHHHDLKLSSLKKSGKSDLSLNMSTSSMSSSSSRSSSNHIMFKSASNLTIPSNEQIIEKYEIFTPDPSKPIYCEYCLKGISGKFFGFRNKYYHPQHFVCNGCKCPLPRGVQKYYNNDMPYCDDCYNRRSGKICGYCNEMIMEKEYIVAFGKKWHINHVYCAVCKRVIGDEGANLFRGKFYCDQDIGMISDTVCDKCLQPINCIEGEIQALGQKWHSNCFVCDICHKKLNSENFQSIDNTPYCTDHISVASHCDYCKKSFIQKFGPKFTRRVRIEDKFYHINHVFCSHCKNPISKLVITGGKDKNINDLYKITEDHLVLCKNCIPSTKKK